MHIIIKFVTGSLKNNSKEIQYITYVYNSKLQ